MQARGVQLFVLGALCLHAAAQAPSAKQAGGFLSDRCPADIGIESNAAVIFAESFESAEIPQVGYEKLGGFYDLKGAPLEMHVTGEEAAVGMHSLELVHPADVTSPAWIHRRFEPQDVVYVRFYRKFERAWVWPPLGAHDTLLFAGAYKAPTSTDLSLYLDVPQGPTQRIDKGGWELTRQPELVLRSALQGPGLDFGLGREITSGEDFKYYYGLPYNKSEAARLEGGRWYCFECMARMNSKPDAKDGEVRLWIDGALVTELTGLTLRNAEHARIGWNHWMLGPRYGGPEFKGGPPAEQKSWIDGLVVAKERIGPAKSRDVDPPYPVLVTESTRGDPAALAALEKPGEVFFTDGFDSEASFASYFEIGGLAEGRALIAREKALVHSGAGSLQLTAPANDGKSSGAGPALWFGPEGRERVHMRYYIRYAEDYDQGNLHHTGGTLSGVAGNDKWGGMGGAGLKPNGDDDFSTRLEGWRDWGRRAPPGYLHFYTYWMDMKLGADGHYWGNMLEPTVAERFVPERGKWICIEEMVRVNTLGKADGELAAWIDGKLYVHYRGLRWRSAADVLLKRASLLVYVHEARKGNTVWFDDFALSTGYIGPSKSK